jgi:hypothetical protein
MHHLIKIGKYRHFKEGKEYNVLGIAKHSETGEDLVLYQKMYDDYSYFVRPYISFTEEVQIGDKKIHRFEYIGE